MQQIELSGFSDEIAEAFDEQLAGVKETGLSYIELRNADGIGAADFTKEKLQEIKHKLDSNGIRVSSIGSPIGKIPVTEAFEPHLEKLKRVVEAAHALQTPNIRMFSFYIPEGEAAEDYRGEVFNRIGRMVSYAAEQGVILLHENEKGIYGDMATRCEGLMKEFYGSHFKAVFDFANFVECGQDTVDAFERLEQYIAYIHIKDAGKLTKNVVPAGWGDGCVALLLGRLKGNGYRGFLSLEPHLVDFSALKSLEADARTRNASMDGLTAWKTALNALKAILWDIDWR